MRTLILVLWLGASALAAPSWKPFASAQAHFSGVFPGAPKATSSQTESPIGAVTTQIFTSTVAVGTYSVACTDLPGAAVRFASQKVLEDTRDAILQDAGAQQQSWVSQNGGYELAYRSPKKQGWSQIFLVGNRLYVLDARVNPGTDKRQWVTPFFGKFSAQ